MLDRAFGLSIFERSSKGVDVYKRQQQQRVAVARAVAAKPPIILADEPTGNLDTKSTQEIMEILKELHRSGRTVIIITHDEEIASQAHRVIRILDGRIEEDYCNRRCV